QVETTLANLRKEVPSRYPIRRYPDITHSRSSQYAVPNWDNAYRSTEGREPINPRPRAYAKIFRDLQQYSMGYITYSEGCNDDLNKIVWSCLGWDPDMKVEDILREYSRYFISARYEEKFAEGLFGLEKNWEGKTLENENSYATLKLFQEMEEDATPQEKLNWRFQQGLYRAYYDAYIKQRLMYETSLEQQAKAVLAAAGADSAEAIEQAQAILDKAVTEPVATELRARVFELAEALYQSIRMQLSVKKYQAIRTNRGANLDEIDKPLAGLRDVRKYLEQIRKRKGLKSDAGLVGTYFNSSGFASPEEGMIDVLATINHKWGDDRGSDWSAQWSGFIEGPVTGEVTFTAEATDGLRLTVGNAVVIDGLAKDGPRTGKVNMTKGKKEPMQLGFSCDDGNAVLRLYWQWAGQSRQLVPGTALSHSPDMVPAEALLFDYDNRLSER
ncbi:MAG: PA14 domain-containing protein, partial [Planctomycetota bacterium]